MKKNPKYIFSQDKNNNELNIQKDDSLEKYFNPIEDSHESEDILKKLENLNFSEETSFELPQKIFEPLTEKQIEQDNMYNKDDDIKNNNEDKKFTKFDLINEPQNKINEENNDNLNDYIKDITNNNNDIIMNNNNLMLNDFIMKSNNDFKEKKEKENDIEKDKNKEKNKLILSEYTLKEKLNRICMSLQGYTLNQKCYINMNNFISFISLIPKDLYQPLDLLFDVFIELLFKIKEEFNIKENLIQKLNNINTINEGFEKKILKLKKEIKDKDKEIGAMMNKINFEKDKIKDNSKSKILEINSLKKENQNLNNRLMLYKNKMRKIEADNKNLQNKLRLYFYEKENRLNYATNINNNNANNNNANNNVNININNNVNKNNINNNKEKENKNNQEEFKINNEKYLSIKRLNMSLVYLLKDINKNVCKYDFSLNKIMSDIQENSYEIEDLDENIETNILIDKNNCKTLCKNFLFNMDVVNNKIIDILKHKDDLFENKIFNTNDNDNDDNQYIYS